MSGGTYRLYGRIGTGSAASEAALAELSAAFDMVEVPGDRGLAAAQGYLEVNPRGQVPALVLPDGTSIAEGTAILLHLADAFPKARFAPPPGSPARARHDRWLLFFQANLYEGELRHYFPDRYVDEPGAAGSVKRAADAYVKRHYALFEAELAAGRHEFGPDLSALEIYLWMLIQWADRAWMAAECPRLLALADRVAARPKVAPVHARHFGA
jgi:glutathione S-transferase